MESSSESGQVLGQLRGLLPPVCPSASLVAGGGTGLVGALLEGLCPSQVREGPGLPSCIHL